MKKIVLLILTILSIACKKGSMTTSYTDISYELNNQGIVKKEMMGNTFFILLEELSPLLKTPGNRMLKKLTKNGIELFTIYSKSEEVLVDFGVQEEVLFILYSTENHMKVKKYDLEGVFISETIVWENTTSVSCATHDRGRIAFHKKSLLIAIRPEDYSTRLFSLHTETLDVMWTQLIEPAQSISGLGMTGGSYDTFEQLAHRYMVFIDTDEEGNTYVVVPALYSSSIYWHNQYFSETLSHSSGMHVSAGLETDALVTKISKAGKREYTVVAGSVNPNECYGIKANSNFFYLYGRSAIPATSFGYSWNSYLGKYNSTTGSSVFIEHYNFGNSGIIYDLAETNSGNLVIVGSTGWTQNPSGFSVSGSARKLVAVIDNLGYLVKEIDVEPGLRHNQVRSVIYRHNKIWISGWENGPGTHTGDASPNLVYADAFLESYEIGF